MRNACSIAVLVLAAAIALLTAEGAFASQGVNYFINSQLTVNGTRSGIQRLTLQPPSDGAMILSVRMQDSISGPSILIQTEYVKQGSSATTVCGTFSGVKAFVEYTPDSVNYTCNTYTDSKNNERFAVVKHSCCTGLWGAYRDGVLLEADQIQTNNGYVMTPAEWIVASGTVSGCWGCSGQTFWQYTTNSGAAYSTIQTESGQINDGGWSIGHAPSPFQIHN